MIEMTSTEHNNNTDNNNNSSVIIVETHIDNKEDSFDESLKEESIVKEEFPTENQNFKKKYQKELFLIIKLSVPIAISEFLKYLIFLISNIFVGHIGSTELAAIALANTFCSSTGWHIFIGLGTALDTLCSQAYTAAKNKEEKKILGIILQRSLFVLFIICIPIAILWAFSEKIFLLLGQDEDVSKMASEYSQIAILALIPYVIFDYFRRFAQTQGIVNPPFYIIAIITPVNILLHYIFINTGIFLSEEKRYLGAPISIVIIYWLLAICMVLYVMFSKAKECWSKINIKAACSGWKSFLKLGIPGMLMVLTEMLAYEVFSIVAGIIGKNELAAQSILISISGCVYNVLIGIATAACVRVGNLLGEGNKKMAKFSSNTALSLSICVGIFNFVLLLVFKKYWILIFSSDEEVNHLAGKVMIILSLFEIADGIVTPGNGILRGCGRQNIGAIMNIVTYWFCGVPLGCILSLVCDLELFGIWAPLAGCLFTLSIIIFTLIQKTNWETMCGNAKKRYENQKSN